MNLSEIFDTKTESIVYYFIFFGIVFILLSVNNKDKEISQYNFLISFGSAILFSLGYSYFTFPGDTLDTSNFWG